VKKVKQYNLRVFFIFMVIFSVLLLSPGCLDLKMHLTVNRDGSADGELTMLVEDSSRDLTTLLGENLEKELEKNKIAVKKELEKQGYTITSISDNRKTGFRASRSWDNLEYFKHEETMPLGLSQNSTVRQQTDRLTRTLPELKVDFYQEKSFFSNTYNLTAEIDMSNFPWIMERTLKAISPDLAFLLTLPEEPLEHNADKVHKEGNTLEWELAPGENHHLKASMKAPRVENIILVLAGGGFILLSAGCLIWRRYKN